MPTSRRVLGPNRFSGTLPDSWADPQAFPSLTELYLQQAFYGGQGQGAGRLQTVPAQQVASRVLMHSLHGRCSESQRRCVHP